MSAYFPVPLQQEEERGEEEEQHIAHVKTSYVDLPLLALCLCNAVDAVETMCFASVLTSYVNPRTNTRVDEDAALSGMLTTSVFIGMLMGGLLAGFLADLLGRKPVLLTCMFINAASALASASTAWLLPASNQVYFLALFRLIAGLGVGGSVPSVFALVAELTTPLTNTCGRRITLLASCWTLGSMFTSLAAWLVLDARDNTETWPIFFIICSLPAWFALGMTWYVVEEGPLASQAHEEEEAEAIPNKYLLATFALVYFAVNFGTYGP